MTTFLSPGRCLWLAASFSFLLACNSRDAGDMPVDAACQPGDSASCSGVNGCQGSQTCNQGASDYGPCVCVSPVAVTGSGGSVGTKSGTATGSGGSVGTKSGTTAGMNGSGGAPGNTSLGNVSQTGCVPVKVSGTYPDYKPARHLSGSCTDEAIRSYYSDCIMKNDCTAFEPGAAEANCGACLAPSSIDAASFGPLLKLGNSEHYFYQTNVAGCEELIGHADCAPKMQLNLLCDHDACIQGCPLDDSSGIAPYIACMNSADTNACKAEHESAACVTVPADAFACWGSDFQTQFSTIARVFCS